MSYAKRGGLILGIIAVILPLLLYTTQNYIFQSALMGGLAITLLVDSIFGGTIYTPVMPFWLLTVLIIVFNLIIYSLVGMLLGWIYGKIKGRAQ